jgi:hypothetical protein
VSSYIWPVVAVFCGAGLGSMVWTRQADLILQQFVLHRRLWGTHRMKQMTTFFRAFVCILGGGNLSCPLHVFVILDR